MPGLASPDTQRTTPIQQGAEARNPLAGVLGRIEEVIHPEAVAQKKRALQVQINVDQITQGGEEVWQENRTLLAEMATAYARNPHDEEVQEKYVTRLASSLFFEQRELYRERSGSVNAYQKDKELRQIEAVLAMTEGKHLHMGTGEGKSSVVIPTAALIEAELGRGAQVTLASATGVLVSELRQHTENLFMRAHKDGIITKARLDTPDKGKLTDFELTKTGRRGLIEYLHREQAHEAITVTGISQQTADRELIAYWTPMHNLAVDPAKEGLRSDSGVPIVFANQTDLVFEWMQEGKSSERTGKIFIDEAHVPFDRNTPYLTADEQLQSDYRELQAQTVDWMVHYLVAQRMSGDEIVADKGSYLLKKEAIDTYAELKLSDYANPDNPGHEVFMQGIQLAMRWFYPEAQQSDPAQMASFQYKLVELITSGVGEVERADSEYCLSAAQRVARHFTKRDRSYMPRAGGGVELRDEYTDQMLYDQSFRDLDRIAATAVAGSFELVPAKMSAGNARYVSFLDAKRDQIVCLSGTLMHPDPEGGHPRKSSFAQFLERYTKRDALQISQIQTKRAPDPVLVNETSKGLGLYDRVFMDLNLTYRGGNRKPTILVDYRSLGEVEETYRRAVERYGADRVEMIVPQPVGGDDPQAEVKYAKQLQDVVRRLAEGKIDVLVSSGSVSLGVNIVRSDGQYPDLQTVCIGMPQSTAQLMQLVGRRRSDEGTSVNHRWYITPESLDEFFGIYDQEGLHVGVEIKKSRERMKELILQEENPRELRKHILDLLGRKEREEEEDTHFFVEYDRLFYQEGQPYDPAGALAGKTVEELLYGLPNEIRTRVNPLRDAVLEKRYQRQPEEAELLKLQEGIQGLFADTRDEGVKRKLEQLYARVFVFGSLMGAKGPVAAAASELVYAYVDEHLLWGEGRDRRLDGADLKTRMRVVDHLVKMFGLPDDLYHDLAAYPSLAPDNRIQAQQPAVMRMRIILDALRSDAFSLKHIIGAWCEDNQERVLTQVKATQLVEIQMGLGKLYAEHPQARPFVSRLLPVVVDEGVKEYIKREEFVLVWSGPWGEGDARKNLCLYTAKHPDPTKRLLYVGEEGPKENFPQYLDSNVGEDVSQQKIPLYLDPISGLPLNFPVPSGLEGSEYASLVHLMPINTPTVPSVAFIACLTQQ